ncbi:hypothetical protein GCM10007390_42480 [Persicitalea jodogahamensis]|uniref:Uncharacterized protein n=1 Tax=Persicitalea jodogahamensis TaxID=402147 RepID=A0A8J3GBM8_9BACT|nr:hypothetical protein GCM10007390_42480 [Persicitalea jodogahamensis]
MAIRTETADNMLITSILIIKKVSMSKFEHLLAGQTLAMKFPRVYLRTMVELLTVESNESILPGAPDECSGLAAAGWLGHGPDSLPH